jgi:signal peptide peptidase SppA
VTRELFDLNDDRAPLNIDNLAAFEPKFTLDSPHVLDYFGIWQVHDQPFKAIVERCQGMDLHAHLQSDAVKQSVSDRDSREYQLSRDGIAIMRVDGPMMKAVPSMGAGVSTVRLRQQIKAARRDPEVRGALLVMDTPGGTAKGNSDLADEVRAFAAEKPIFAFIEDLTASAGVAIASQTTKRYANNPNAMYGAMGTYAVIEDQSARAEKLGVKVHVIRAGEYKGMAESGTEVTEQHLAELQRIVNSLNEEYLSTIARGLNKSVEYVRPLADGRIIFASNAVAAGLLDGVQTFEATYQELVALTARSSTGGRKNMSQENNKAATLAELKAAFPNSTADWRESQLEAGSTLEKAAMGYATFVETRAKAREEELQKQVDAAKNSKPAPSLGHPPLTMRNVGGDEDGLQLSGDPVADFSAAVASRLPRGRTPSREERNAAIGYVARTNPQLHREYLLATNAKTGKIQRLITEKFEGVSAE